MFIITIIIILGWPFKSGSTVYHGVNVFLALHNIELSFSFQDSHWLFQAYLTLAEHTKSGSIFSTWVWNQFVSLSPASPWSQGGGHMRVTHTHTHLHYTYMHACIDTCTHTHTHTHKHTHTHACTDTCTHSHTGTCGLTHSCACVYTCLHAHAYASSHMLVYTHTHIL